MGRSRYKVVEPTYPHFVTCTVLHWLPLFTGKEKDNLKLYAFVILENHFHSIRYTSGDVERVKGVKK